MAALYIAVCVCVCLCQFTNINFVLYHEKDRINPTAYFRLGWLSWLFVFVCLGGLLISRFVELLFLTLSVTVFV